MVTFRSAKKFTVVFIFDLLVYFSAAVVFLQQAFELGIFTTLVLSADWCQLIRNGSNTQIFVLLCIHTLVHYRVH